MGQETKVRSLSRYSKQRLVAFGLGMALVLSACASGDQDAVSNDTGSTNSGDVDNSPQEVTADEKNVFGGIAPPAGFPRRPITLTVVYGAGGGMDVTARTLAAVAEELTGFEFQVENRTGAAGLVGHTFLATESRPDGYEVGVLANLLFEDIILRDVNFGISQFQPLGLIGFDPLILVTSTSSRVAGLDLNQIMEFSRQNPGDLRMGTVPPGLYESVDDLLESQAGVAFNRIRYDGGAAGITDLLGGNIDVFKAFFAEIESQVTAGNIQPLAIVDQTPDPRLVGVPALKDLGFEVSAATFGASRFLTVPAETDAAIIEYLAAMFNHVLMSDLAKERFGAIGVPLSPFAKTDAEAWFGKTFATLEAELSQK